MLIRQAARQEHAMRKVSFVPNVSRTSDGSCLANVGNTQVLCTASLEEGGAGGIIVEYGVLPGATVPRTPRYASPTERTVDVQMAIAQALEVVLDQDVLGGKYTLRVDCDVLQSEGSLKTAAISGAYVATCLALRKWSSFFVQSPVMGQIAALSCGIVKGEYIVDMDHQEWIEADAIVNFVLSEGGDIVAMDVVGKRCPLTMSQIQRMADLAVHTTPMIFQAQREALGPRLVHG